MTYYVDVHCHLTHDKFEKDWREVIERAKAAGLNSLVVNGLEPHSNRKILEWAREEPVVKAALGIYPVNGVSHLLPKDFPFSVEKFNVKEELQFIREQAELGDLVAVGECGLDGYWLGEDTHSAQEETFSYLLDVAHENDIPVIIHSRKMERKAFEMVASHGNKKVVFHCYGGKTKWALDYASKFPWCFSIPATAHRNEAFAKLLRELPPESLLTETDSPYLAPEKSARNEPSNVVRTVALLAELRAWSLSRAKNVVYSNYKRLFSK